MYNINWLEKLSMDNKQSGVYENRFAASFKEYGQRNNESVMDIAYATEISGMNRWRAYLRHEELIR